MATFTATAAQSTAIPTYMVSGTVTRHVVFSLGTIPTLSAAGDVIQMVKVPSGAIINDVKVGIISHTGVATVNVGIGSDISLFGASVVLSGMGVDVLANSMPARGLGYTFTAEDTIDIQCAAVSANSAVGKLILKVEYSNQN